MERSFYFCKVMFPDTDKLYTYITKDKSIREGDSVTVPTGNGFVPDTKLKQVVETFEASLDELEFPIERLRCIEEKLKNLNCPNCGASIEVDVGAKTGTCKYCQAKFYLLGYEDLIRKSYTIGGMTIFPMHSQSINQRRGCSTKISDRWDLTLECIRRYYKGQESPLYRTLEKDKAFFDLFVNFKGYVDYFFFQDAVSDDYSSVDIWCGKGDFSEDGLPKTVDEYFSFIEKELEFLDKRNKRIRDYCIENNL